ncbi:NAD(P)-binding protein, partial [Sistotremastrum suecicum HHB10207 ss-3]
LGLYLSKINGVMSRMTPEALSLSPNRWTSKEIQEAYEAYVASPVPVQDSLPPKTGRRYIVVGGSGFLGGWIVVHLLARGEKPSHIRIIDMREPTRSDLTTGDASKVAFFKANITNPDEVEAAFLAPWPADVGREKSSPLTVFHTAANIRFYERALFLVPHSARVNIDGTRNILAASRKAGASILVYTSSGSVAIQRTKYWIWPWQSIPKHFVQVLNDDDLRSPKEHSNFWSNYAYTKTKAERSVRDADKSVTDQGSLLRTGCIRPGNGVYGPGKLRGDILAGAYLIRKVNPTWVTGMIQSFVYVENVSLSHLCYEQRLIELESSPSRNPDIGGQAYMITDPNPPITFGDLYKALNLLSNGETVFPAVPPIVMLVLAHAFELWYLARARLLGVAPITRNSPAWMRIFAKIFPPLGGDLVNLQPSLFPLTSVHLLFDDSRAKLSPSAGGLGYNPPFTTMTGLCKLCHDYLHGARKPEERQAAGGGVSLGFGLPKAERGVEKVAEKL